VTKSAQSANFVPKNLATFEQLAVVEFRPADDGITTALAEYAVLSMSELSGRICLPSSTKLRYRTLFLHFTIRH
jgi:hypothetical protein